MTTPDFGAASSVGRFKAVTSESRLDGADALPYANRSAFAPKSPMIDEAGLRHVAVPLPTDLDTTEMVKAYLAIETQLEGKANPIVQLASPNNVFGAIDIGYGLAAVAAKLLGKKILLIDAGLPGSALTNVSCVAAPVRASQASRRKLAASEEAAQRSLNARWPVIEHVQQAKQLSEVFDGTAFLEDGLLKSGECNLFVSSWGAGSSSSVQSGYADMSTLLKGLRGHFDMVLIVPPPVLSAPAASILANNVNASVLVVQAGSARAFATRRAARALHSVGAPLIGVILTQHRSFLPAWLRWLRR